MPTPPTHDPNSQPIGDNPFIFTNEEGDTFYWDFNKKKWFIPQEQEDEEEDTPAPPPALLGKRKRETPTTANTVEITDQSEKEGANPPEKKKKKNKKKKKPNSSIFISNLPKNATVEEIYEFSKTAGIIQRDPYTGEYFIRLYPNPDGSFSGEALVTFFKSDSIPLALEILDGKYFRNAPAKVTVAKFNKTRQPIKPIKPQKNQPVKFDQSKDLSWDEENRVHIVIKGLFHPSETWTDPDFVQNLKEEIREECETFGEIELLTVFENHPEGVAAVKFKEALPAKQCIEKMDGRYFAKKKLSADYFDGTNYKVEETPEQKAQREAAWNAFLEQD